jgi:hypothetical protein
MSVEPWGFWQSEAADLPLPVRALQRMQAEAAREQAEARREEEQRLARAEARQERAVMRRLAEAQLVGSEYDPRDLVGSLSRTVGEVLAEAEATADREDAKARAAAYLSRDDVEVIGVVEPRPLKAAPPAVPVSRSLPLKARVRLALQRMATGTDEQAIARMAAEPGREVTRYVQDSEAIVR